MREEPRRAASPIGGLLRIVIYGLSCKITPFRVDEMFSRRDAAGLGLILHKSVVLVGMMGAGKTAVGLALSRRLGVAFLDSDAEIEAAANRTIAEIFQRDGEAFFRDRESEIIARLLEGPPGILSTGGGAYLAPMNRQMISEKGAAIWLRADLELLWNRVRHKDTRPLLRTKNPKATLEAIMIERTPFYEQADVVVDASASYAIEDAAEAVEQALLLRPDVLSDVVAGSAP
jgi:shikimate kinase